MPLKGERKREYNRLRQRRLRGYQGEGRTPGRESEGGVVPDVVPMLSPALKGNVVPQWVSEVPDPFGSKSGKAALDYQAYLAVRGLTMVKTSCGKEFVDLVTGEVGVYGGGAWKGLTALQERLTALERAYVQHQAEHVVQEAPRGYSDYLFEEEGIVEDDWGLYAQHPTEHTLRKGQ